MPHRRRDILAGLVALTSCGNPSRRNEVNESHSLPRLAAALGQTIDTVVVNSTCTMDLSQFQDDGAVTVSKQVQFSYAGPGGWPLAPTRFVSLTCTAAIVVGIQLAPQIDYVERDEMLKLLEAIRTGARENGWNDAPDQTDVTGSSELGALTSSPDASETAWYVGRLTRGSAALGLRLRRLREPGNARAAVYLLNLQWYDRPLARRAATIVKQLRKKDGVSIDLWRPIDLGSYVPRVRALLADA